MMCLTGLWGVLAAAVSAQTTVTGSITEDTTWSGTVIVQGTVTVVPGVVLTISPGTSVLMKSAAALQINGQLLADGSQSQQIRFTRELAGVRWKQIKFTNAASSRLRHCLFEYANCEGTHLDYYDTDCNSSTTPPARNYHEAIVAIGSHVDFETCIFQNLPDSTGTREGDAIAIISDDPVTPGAASAHFVGCRFLSIGQGIHTRFSSIVVENCYFTDHHGDNDDIDMYGESTPPPMILYNLFENPAHDDMINPTRCSAIIIGNVVFGSDDHGIVLRDAGFPVVMNNLVYNCAAGGISVQNQCDALLINNTIVNCGRGVRLFDHTSRWTPPYCLTPGSGKATLINCIIWDCPESLTLTDSPHPEDRGSHVTVIHCNIEGGQASAVVSTNSTLTWGAGNINADPLFVSATNRHLQAASPCIDAGINPATVTTNPAAVVNSDLDGTARPLDGNGDGTARFDIGAYEFLLATADSNGDGIPDGWLQGHGLSPVDPSIASGNPDRDAYTTLDEWLADTDPNNPLSFLRLDSFDLGPPTNVRLPTSANRRYTLYYSSDLAPPGAAWTPVPGQIDVPGNGSVITLTEPGSAARMFYRVGVRVP
ncbi:MAG: right-handed parallel beta-helix repeat-containing protein [Verrucomicrobiales bacterium]